MNFLDLAKERYSCRYFSDKKVEQEKIDKILEAARLAPTGKNSQSQRILVLTEENSLNKLKNCTKCHFDAPNAMIICYNKDESWVRRRYDGALSAPVDASIVTTYLMQGAWDLGVGTCLVMSFDPDAVIKEFNIPSSYIPLLILVMGYPAEDSTPLDMHYKFRPLEEVVSYEKF